jgi:hypothetical protein
LQVRAPFEEWKDAVLSSFPWIDTPGGAVPDVAYTDRLEDTCAKAICAQFSYLDSALANPRARCADIVGTRDSAGAILPLTPYGSYDVRALAELRTPDDLRAQFTLPERVLAAPPETSGQTSLVPGSLLPVVGNDGQPRTVGSITGISSTAGGRFALVDGQALSVIGDGADTLSQNAQGNVGAADAPQGAFGEDGTASTNLDDAFTSDVGAASAEPLALLAAGDWVRVVRRLDTGAASVEKVYVGTSAGAAAAGPAPGDVAENAEHPALHIDPTSTSAGTGLRAFSYLAPGANALDDEGALPRDEYLLLYGTAFVLIEQAPAQTLALGYFASGAARDVDGNIVGTTWAGSRQDDQDLAAFGGACGRLSGDNGASPDLVDNNPGVADRVNVSVCYDVGSALGQDVDLRDMKLLGDLSGSDSTGSDARAVFSDARNDRLLVAPLPALECSDCNAAAATPLSTQLAEVRVGREPEGMLRTRVLDCGGAGLDRPVLLVANHGSGDVSVVEDDGTGSGTTVETAVLPLSSPPVSFLDDADGATCGDPFVWAIADDGTVIPIDMRGEPSVPPCKGASCSVGTRGRGAVGAISRQVAGGGPSRSLVGGNGLLGELGFFRPKALLGAAYESGGDLGVGVAPAPSAP